MDYKEIERVAGQVLTTATPEAERILWLGMCGRRSKRNEWHRRSALERCIREKAEKRYSTPVKLLVYLNVEEYGFYDAEIRTAIA